MTVTTLPRSRALTREDLDAMPDDGHRYELLDGSLIVTPAPAYRHQLMVARLLVLLDTHRPADLVVLTAPFDVALAVDTVLQPDLLVARRADFTERDLPVAPLLAVEVLSPSTRHIDLSLKRARYEASGCPSYWVLDPQAPSLTAWHLGDDGGYQQLAYAVGEREYAATTPYPVTISPAVLLS